MNHKIITILCSGVALGVYIPALLVDYQLRNKGVATEVIVLENLMGDDKKRKILENKKAFHSNFRVALTGQKMARDLWANYELGTLENMFAVWLRENRRDFIAFSGFWMPVLGEYVKRSKCEELNLDIVHMDADISASWKHFQTESRRYNNIWLFDWKEKKLRYEIPVTQQAPIPYNERPERYVIHGGGWGMGTYQNKISELETQGLPLDIVAYDFSETTGSGKENRYFMVDPDWSPWIKNNENRHEFPPFGEIRKEQPQVFQNKPEYHELYDVIRFSKGIVSKPGGATLVDSLSSATPIIMLDPFGDYEQKNAELWEHMGFGISYRRWKDSGFSSRILEELHSNLLKAKGPLIDYANDYITRSGRGGCIIERNALVPE